MNKAMTKSSAQWIKASIAIVILGALSLAGYFAWSRYYSLERYHIETTQAHVTINHWVTPNGATVVFVPLAELPILDVTLLFPAGSAYDEQDFGIAQLTSQMIGQSTDVLNAQSIHEAFESMGAIFSTGSTKDYATIQVRTLTDTAVQTQIIGTLEAVIKEARFNPEDFAREQSRLLTIIDSMNQSAFDINKQTFTSLIYGNHPYAHPVYGEKTTVSALTPEKLEAFYHEHYHQSGAVLTLVGNLTMREATALADRLLSQLPAQGKPRGIPAVEILQARTQHITFPSTQTHVLWGMPVMTQDNPDYFAFTVGNQLLGAGQMNSLLFGVIREKEGLAYSVGSRLTPQEQLGPFVVRLQTRNEQAEQAITLMKSTVEYFMNNPLDPAQLQATKDNLKGQFALALASNEDIAAFVSTLAYYHLPWDYAEQYSQRIDAVTPEDIHRVFHQYLHPDAFSLVTVGATRNTAAQ